jgi:hypothetical protein
MEAAHQSQLVLAGDVADFDVGSLMMVFGLGRQLITLEIDDGAGNAQGQMVIKGGRIVSAAAGELSGPDAVRKLLMVAHPSRFRVLRSANTLGPELTSIGDVADFTEFSELVEPPSPDEPVPLLHGELKDFVLADVLRALAVARQYMVLRVLDERGENAGSIKLKGGQVLGADAGELVDLPALQELLASPPSYRFAVHHEQAPQSCPRPLGAISELLPMAAAVDPANTQISGFRPTQSPPPTAKHETTGNGRVRVMEGNLAKFDVTQLLQVVSAGRQYVEVEIFDGRAALVGTIEIKAGMLVAARMGSRSGIDAARSLLGSPSHFQFKVYRRRQQPDTMTALARMSDLLAGGASPSSDDVDTVVTPHVPGAPARRSVQRQPAMPVPVLDGNLTDFDLASLLQVVSTSRQHTSVRIFDDQRQLAGEVHVKAGQLLKAEALDEEGLFALRRLLHSPRDFTFVVLRHPLAAAQLTSLGTITDLLARAAAPTATFRLEARDGRTGEASLLTSTPWQRPQAGPSWLVGAALGAGFVLVGAGAATLLLKQAASAPDHAREIVAAAARTSEPAATPTQTETVTAPATTSLPSAAGAVFGPADTDPALLGKPAIASMQAALAQLGYDPGPIDGVFGPKTSAAIRAFQHAEELLVDGTLSTVTRTRLAARVGGL